MKYLLILLLTIFLSAFLLYALVGKSDEETLEELKQEMSNIDTTYNDDIEIIPSKKTCKCEVKQSNLITEGKNTWLYFKVSKFDLTNYDCWLYLREFSKFKDNGSSIEILYYDTDVKGTDHSKIWKKYMPGLIARYVNNRTFVFFGADEMYMGKYDFRKYFSEDSININPY